MNPKKKAKLTTINNPIKINDKSNPNREKETDDLSQTSKKNNLNKNFVLPEVDDHRNKREFDNIKSSLEHLT